MTPIITDSTLKGIVTPAYSIRTHGNEDTTHTHTQTWLVYFSASVTMHVSGIPTGPPGQTSGKGWERPRWGRWSRKPVAKLFQSTRSGMPPVAYQLHSNNNHTEF